MSMFSISIKGGLPIYEQLCGRITELISTNVMQKDEKLPAVREVAKQLGVNPNTVQKAYTILEQRGLIYSVPAKGSYVSKSEEGIISLRKGAMKTFTDSAKSALGVGIEKQALTEIIDKI
jgi:GntR family transcriptional regulator